MSAPLSKPYLSLEEYLAIEERASVKSEYIDGEMFAMAGGSFEHATISLNVGSELRQALKGTDCVAASADCCIAATDSDFAAYPDVTVVCGPPVFLDSKHLAVTNPAAVFEVLSDSTEAYDRGGKFRRCRAIPSLRTYVLISQGSPLVEVFTRQPDDSWLLEFVPGLDGVAVLPALDIELALSEIYAGIDFSPDRELPGRKT